MSDDYTHGDNVVTDPIEEAWKEIQRLRADINMLMQSRTDALHTAERLRAALEAAPHGAKCATQKMTRPYSDNLGLACTCWKKQALKGSDDE